MKNGDFYRALAGMRGLPAEDLEMVRSQCDDLRRQLDAMGPRLDAVAQRDRQTGANSRSRAAVRGHLRRKLNEMHARIQLAVICCDEVLAAGNA